MRLFTAINFNHSTKNKIILIQNELKKYTETGNFSREENLHLTLVFLGEVEAGKLPEIKKVMDAVSSPGFELVFCKTGFFKQDRGDIWWIGAGDNPILTNLQGKMSEEFRKSGFFVESRKFTPHLTLAREVVLNGRPQLQFEAFGANVQKISLMKSERINGKLTYTEIYEKLL